MLALALSLHLAAPPPVALPPARLRLVDLQLESSMPRGDPHAGGTAGLEVLAGSGTALLADAVSVVAFVGGVVLSFTFDDGGGDNPAVGVPMLLGSLALHLAGVPILTALAESGVGSLPRAGSLGRAIGYAFAARGAEIVLIIGPLVALSVMGLNGAAAALFITYMLADLFAIPLAASYGLHDGPSAASPDAPPAPPTLGPPDAVPPELQPPPRDAHLGLSPGLRLGFAF